MYTISEMIVLLWLLPVAINIILPLITFGCWLIGRLFAPSSRHAVSVQDAKEDHAQSKQMLSTTGN